MSVLLTSPRGTAHKQRLDSVAEEPGRRLPQIKLRSLASIPGEAGSTAGSGYDFSMCPEPRTPPPSSGWLGVGAGALSGVPTKEAPLSLAFRWT